jgi:Ricin-type beta-trefoil lectin domain
MRDFRKAIAALAATGIAALGVVAATGGVASAGTDRPVTGCNISSKSLLTIGVVPSCSAGKAKVLDPTGFAVFVNPSFFNVLGALVPILGERVNWTLKCSVDGGTVAKSGTFTATMGKQEHIIDLQHAVGSPAPNSCTFTHLTATSTIAITGEILALLRLNLFNFGVSVIANNGVPGSIWAQYPDHRTICADVLANGNHGTPVHAYQCEQDLADQWTSVPTGQLVHNGDCLDNSPHGVLIDACQAKPAPDSSQVWEPQQAGGPGQLTNGENNECLTAPVSGVINGTRLTVRPCVNGDIGQQWKLPPVSPGNVLVH